MKKLGIGEIVRLANRPERGLHLLVRICDAKVTVRTENAFKTYQIDLSKFERVPDEELPANSPVVEFRDAERAALADVPERLHKEIRRFWYLSVSGGGTRFDASSDRSALESQKEISSLLKREGISESNKAWKAVIGFGRRLYHE